MWIVFFLSGFWHGASWNFIIWGLYHGLFLSLAKLVSHRRSRIPAVVAVPSTFVLVLLGWVFFRAENLPAAATYFRCLFSASQVSTVRQIAQVMTPQAWLALALALLYSFLPAVASRLRSAEWAIPEAARGERSLVVARSAVTGLLVLLCMMALVTSKFNPFIYFRF